MSRQPGTAAICIMLAVSFSDAADGSPKKRDKHVQPEELGLQLPANFFSKTFEKRWASLPGPKGARALFRSLWSKSQVLRHAKEAGFKAYERGFSRYWADSDGGETAGITAAEEALRNNITLVQNHVHRKHPPLARHMRLVSVFFGLPGGMNSYTTPPTGQGFAYHFDPSDSFILQVEGTKAWEVCKRRLPNPFGFADPTYNQIAPEHTDAQNCTKLTLEEGDAIYLPIGQIHRAVASEGYSVHLTMSLNRQFLSKSAMLLNVAEQINPSKTYGFAQKEFLEWVHRASADAIGTLKAQHDVPRVLLCTQGGWKRPGGKRCRAEKGFLNPHLLSVSGREEPLSLALEEKQSPMPEEMLEAYVEEMKQAVAELRGHASASEPIKMGMRISGKEEPVVGKIPASQVLDGLAPLLSPLACSKAIAAWREFFAKQAAEYDEAAMRSGMDLDDEKLVQRVFSDSIQNEELEEIEEEVVDHRAESESEAVDHLEGAVYERRAESESEYARDAVIDAAGSVKSHAESIQDMDLDGITFVDLEDQEVVQQEQQRPLDIYFVDVDDADLDAGVPSSPHDKLNADQNTASTSSKPAVAADGFAWDYPEESSPSADAVGERESMATLTTLKEELHISRARCKELELQLQDERAARRALETEIAKLRKLAGAGSGHVEVETPSNAARPKVQAKSTTSAKSGEHSASKVSSKLKGKCCKAASASVQVRCANHTAPPDASEDPSRVLIITYATPHVHSYARYALAVNSNWARRFNHSFVIDTRDRADGTVDVKNAKVLVKQHWVSRPGISEKWALWIGADAVLADFDANRKDVLRRLIAEHGKDPRVQIIITRDPSGRAGNSMSLFNADVILLRRSEWTSEFLMRWWDDPRMKEGRTDQEVLELLYTEDVLGASSAFVLLPPLTLNSETLSIVAGPPRMQPVIHLGGHADNVRSAVFKETLAMVCERESGPNPDSTELQDVYIDALWQEVRAPGAGVSSGHMHGSTLLGTFQRLAHHMEQRDRVDEALSVQRAALKLGEERLGPRHRDTLHAAAALGTALRSAQLIDESEVLHRRAHQGLLDTLGWENRETLTSANNLALVLQERGRPNEAEYLFRGARRGMLRSVGANAPSMLATSVNLAALLAAQRDRPKALKEADSLYREAASGREKVHGPDHPDTLDTMDSLAQFLVTSGRATEAEPVVRTILSRRTSTLGPLDVKTAMSTSILAQSLKIQGRAKEAVGYFELALSRCREIPDLGGPSGPNALAAASNLASALQDVGRISEAGAHYKQAAVGLRRALGRDHPNTRGAIRNYEQFLREVGKPSADAHVHEEEDEDEYF